MQIQQTPHRFAYEQVRVVAELEHVQTADVVLAVGSHTDLAIAAFRDFLRMREYETYFNPGRRQFLPHTKYVIIDIDGDGIPELVVKKEHDNGGYVFVFSFDVSQNRVASVTTSQLRDYGNEWLHSTEYQALVQRLLRGMQYNFFTIEIMSSDNVIHHAARNWLDTFETRRLTRSQRDHFRELTPIIFSYVR